MTRLRLADAVALATVALLIGFAATPSPARAAETDPAHLSELLAGALGVEAARLSELRVTEETLLDGRRLTTVKAIDQETGAPVGGSFVGGQSVDRLAEIRRAGAAWRRAHGAITPGLARQLDRLAPGERTLVAVWLALDLRAVDEGKAERDGGAPDSGSAAGTPATDSRAEATSPPIAETKPSSVARPFLDQREEQARAETQAATQEADRVRRAAVNAAVAAVRDRFVADTLPFDLDLRYASEVAPMAVFEARREVIEVLSRWATIDALDDASGVGGPSLFYARPTQNMVPINDLGYDGTGVSVSVTEGERAFFANPYLTLTGSYDGGEPYQSHPTAVAGIIRSTHDDEHGLADNVTLYSANGSYGNFATQSAAMDYGSTQARVLNNSWYWDSPNSASFWEVDRHQDYFVRTYFDTVVVAAGNFGNGCGANFSSYVVSPAKGHNILAVGNYDDLDTVSWSDDVMDNCSSFGNPNNSAGTGTQEKPEIAAVGAGIYSTTTSDPWVGPVGSGTSYASPMVAALSADMMEADAAIENDPEAVKAVLLATALHNIEGSARLSGKDGTGGIVGAAAIVSIERGNWAIQSIGSGTTFPVVYTQHAYSGERVRFAIAWSANPNAPYTTDPLPADVDLCAYRADNTTLITCSSSATNAYEIVDFVAPASEVYRFKASLFSSDWTSGGTWLGAGWWRGEYRIVEDTGYLDPHPPPTGEHFVVVPTDWSPTNYWRAFGVRPVGTSDYDLELTSRSLFEDPSQRVVEADSFAGSGETDFVVVDGNHRSSSTVEHYRTLRYDGTEGYYVGFSNLGIPLNDSVSTEIGGPVSMPGTQTVKVFDVFVPAQSHRRLRVVPTAGSADLAIYVHKSNPGASASWVQGRSEALEARNRSALGTFTERVGVENTTVNGDWLGLVVVNRGGTAVNFQVEALPPSVFSDDFEGNDLVEWTGSVP